MNTHHAPAASRLTVPAAGRRAGRRAAAARAAELAAQMDPLFDLPTTTDSQPAPVQQPAPIAAPPPTLPPAPAEAERDLVAAVERLPHPNPHQCAHCTNRATLRLILVTGCQIVTCRPCASRYPR